MKNLSELALFTDQVEETTSFYERLLEAAPVYRSTDMALFKVGGVTILIHRRSPPMKGGPANIDHFAFSMYEIDAACQELEAQGLTMLHPPRDYDWGRSAYLLDPDGRMVELQQGKCEIIH